MPSGKRIGNSVGENVDDDGNSVGRLLGQSADGMPLIGCCGNSVGGLFITGVGLLRLEGNSVGKLGMSAV
jgi:hypothetical protein